jgi:hypothetical protein
MQKRRTEIQTILATFLGSTHGASWVLPSAMKQGSKGTSGLPEVTDDIDGTQSCMCCEATHAAEKVSS